jgi:hypothetical protein
MTSVAEPLMASAVAVMVAWPLATPVARPVARSTVTTPGADDLHWKLFPGRGFPFASVAEALN